MNDREIRLTLWDDGYHWTVFDADPDYESGQVEGAVVPWAMAEQREPSQIKALRRALIAAAPGTGCGSATVRVPLAAAAAWAVICEVDHASAGVPEEAE